MQTKEEAEKLFMQNEKLIYYVYNRMNPYCLEKEDALQILRIGLWKAARIYDHTRGEFSTIAYKFMYWEIMHAMHNCKNTIQTVSLDDEVFEGQTYSETIEDKKPFEEDVIHKIEFGEFYKKLKKRDQRILRMTRNGITQVVIGKKCGISQNHVSRTVKRLHRQFEKQVG